MRFFDIILSLFGLILLLPLLIIIFFIILFIARYPLFFQNRVGLNQKLFVLVKFRTMKIGTREAGTHLINRTNITSFGKLLRFIKFDEFPQLWNVLKGDMSIVGPRPCLFNQKKLINERKKRGIFKVRPGITGIAQIKGLSMSQPVLLAKTELKMIKKMNLVNYFYYILITFFYILKLKKKI
jgi:lipopolysaccharide/colanic/teichoic acid biosynthesis glycosyltransferase